MKRRELKKEILSLLGKKNWPDIAEKLPDYHPKSIINHLFTSLCSTDEISKWHGVSAFGIVVPIIAAAEMEDARVIMRRFLWCLNDESGGIGWGIPEAMAEVMSQHKQLFTEYSTLLISYMREDGPEVFQDGNHLELPALQRGLLWGVGRLLATRNAEMLSRNVEEDIANYLESEDKIVQGMAVWCLGMCEHVSGASISRIEGLANNRFCFPLYHNNRLEEVNIGEIATASIKRLESFSLSRSTPSTSQQ